jgi:hypothetical protein
MPSKPTLPYWQWLSELLLLIAATQFESLLILGRGKNGLCELPLIAIALLLPGVSPARAPAAIEVKPIPTSVPPMTHSPITTSRT